MGLNPKNSVKLMKILQFLTVVGQTLHTHTHTPKRIGFRFNRSLNKLTPC